MDSHICRSNHNGSAPAMELSCAKHIFKGSIELNQMRYTEYFCNGDSISFPSIEQVYGPDLLVKQECNTRTETCRYTSSSRPLRSGAKAEFQSAHASGI